MGRINIRSTKHQPRRIKTCFEEMGESCNWKTRCSRRQTQVLEADRIRTPPASLKKIYQNYIITPTHPYYKSFQQERLFQGQAHAVIFLFLAFLSSSSLCLFLAAFSILNASFLMSLSRSFSSWRCLAALADSKALTFILSLLTSKRKTRGLFLEFHRVLEEKNLRGAGAVRVEADWVMVPG